jgi:hypothetical protein
MSYTKTGRKGLPLRKLTKAPLRTSSIDVHAAQMKKPRIARGFLFDGYRWKFSALHKIDYCCSKTIINPAFC